MKRTPKNPAPRHRPLTIGAFAAFGVLAATVASASSAFADTPRAEAPEHRARAEALDAEATALMQARRHKDACPKLAESARLFAGTGVLLRLGLCYELTGMTASARAAFREAAARARAAGDTSLTQLAVKRADALDARMPRVTIRVAPEPERVDALVVRRDAVALERSTPSALPEEPAAARATTAPAGASPQRTYAVAAGAVSVLGLATGTLMGLSVASKMSRAREMCGAPPGGCGADALALQDGARASATWSTIGFGVGAAGLIAGVALWVTAPSHEPARDARMRVSPALGKGEMGLQIEGTF